MSRCQYIHNCLGCFGDVCVSRAITESDSEVVLLRPSSQDRFDVVILGAGHIDFVSDDVCGHLDTFPRSVPAESKGVDLSVLEGRSLGSGVGRGSGYGGSMYRLVFGQNVRVVCGVRG